MRPGKRILIVDDARTMTGIVARILKDANYSDVDCLYDGVSALAALGQKEPRDLAQKVEDVLFTVTRPVS